MASSTRHASQPILAAVDLQSHSLQVVKHALSLGQEQGRPVLLLHVVHETEKSAGFYRRHSDGNYILPMRDIAEKMLRQLLDDVVAEHGGEAGLPRISMRVVSGVPAGRIVEVAEQADAATIVMMNDDHSGFSWLWCCSVAEDVLKQTNRNMVLLHPDIGHVLPMGLESVERSQLHAN